VMMDAVVHVAPVHLVRHAKTISASVARPTALARSAGTTGAVVDARPGVQERRSAVTASALNSGRHSVLGTQDLPRIHVQLD
jgi:hypothetical protein